MVVCSIKKKKKKKKKRLLLNLQLSMAESFTHVEDGWLRCGQCLVVGCCAAVKPDNILMSSSVHIESFQMVLRLQKCCRDSNVCVCVETETARRQIGWWSHKVGC